MSARFYSPGIGAFTQLDSVMGGAQNPFAMNRFLYALANPTTFIDPDGHMACAGWNEDCQYQRKPEMRREAARAKKYHTTNRYTGRTRESDVERRSTRHRGQTNGQVAADRRARMNAAAADARETAVINSATSRRELPCAGGRLNCSYEQILGMDVSDRVEFVRDFQSEFDTGGWFNAFEGVIQASSDHGLGKDSWFSSVDARVLFNMQQGMVVYKGDKPRESTDGAKGFGRFYAALYSGDRDQGSDANLRVLHAAAEQLSVDQGQADARRLDRRPTVGESYALAVANTYRGLISIGLPLWDQRDYSAGYWGFGSAIATEQVYPRCGERLVC